MGLHRFVPFEFDSGTGRLRKHGLRIKLQQKPQIVLATLLEEPTKTFTRQELYGRLWPEGTHVDFDQGLNVAVKKLRDALGDTTDTPSYIATVQGVGYRFIGDVEEVNTRETLPQVAVRTESDPALSKTLAGEAPEERRRFSWSKAFALAGSVALGALLFVFVKPLSHRNLMSTRSLIAAPPDWQLLTMGDIGGSIALSPDGTQAIYGASNARSGSSMLLLRRLDALSAEPIAGSEGAFMPFWSPDGRKVAFFAGEKLKMADLSSGAVRDICSVAESARGGTWGAGDDILFAESTRGPIMRVSASGGTPAPVTSLTGSRYTTHRWPEFLPDGRHFLFLAARHDQPSTTRPAVFLGSLDGSVPRLLVESDSNALFESGQLLFVSGGKLLAQSFDPLTNRVGSVARILADNVEYDDSLWHAAFSATPQLLVFRQRPDTPEGQVIVFLDTSGKTVKTASRPGKFRGVSVSPNGKSFATTCDDQGGDVCLIRPDMSVTRISEKPITQLPAWSPDGRTLAYGTHRDAGRNTVVVKDANGQGPERVLMEFGASLNVSAWVPGQTELLVERENAKGKVELGTLQIADGKFRTLLGGGFNVNNSRFSPDGKWLAYQSDESGQNEVYVTSYPAAKQTVKISSAGGHAPRWKQDGRELFFLDATEMIQQVRITTAGDGLHIESAKPLFRPPIVLPPYDAESFDVTGPEPLFVVNRNSSQNNSGYVLVTGWQ